MPVHCSTGAHIIVQGSIVQYFEFRFVLLIFDEIGGEGAFDGLDLVGRTSSLDTRRHRTVQVLQLSNK